jgi:hypothetical protein
MIPVPKKHLPENRPKVLSPEELAERREAARERLAMKKGAPKSRRPINSSTQIFINLLPEPAGSGSRWTSEPAAGVR